MTPFISIVAFLAVLTIVVISHELGHFGVARLANVRVDEFGFFYPPRLFAIKRGETEYSLNLLPLGGFVRVADDPDKRTGLSAKGPGTRLLFLSAGTIVNALLPIVLFSAAFIIPHTILQGRILVDSVNSGSPAEMAGIVAGDTITSLNGQPLNNSGDLSRETTLNLGKEMTLGIIHAGGSTTVVRVEPRWRPPADQGAIGIKLETVDIQNIRESLPFYKAIPMSFKELYQTFVLFKNLILGLIFGTYPFDFIGPVGLAQVTGQVAQAGISQLLEFTAFLSVNLAIVNILPLPALDGGRMVFVVLEWLRRGKRVPAKQENMVHIIGYALLIALMVLVTYQDIARIIAGG